MSKSISPTKSKALAIYAAPTIMIVYGLFLRFAGDPTRWDDLVGILSLTVGVLSALVCTFFVLLNKFYIKWKIKAWTYFILSIASVIAAFGFLLLTVRISSWLA